MKFLTGTLLVAFVSAAMLPAEAADVVVENDAFRLVVGGDAAAKSLVVKATGEECVDASKKVPLLTVTQDRPFDNELKLVHPNKRVVYPATKVRREGDALIFGFDHGMYEAKVVVKTAPGYMLFTLSDFLTDRRDSYSYLKMDVPQASSCRFVQLPVRSRKNFGEWLNVCWDDRAAVCVAGASPHPDIDSDDLGGARALYAEAITGIRLRGCSAALIAAPGREAFLDAMDAFECDLDLPRGVRSRRSDVVKEPIFHVAGDFSPTNIEKTIAYMKRGGFRLVTLSYHNVFKETASWGFCGDYDWREDYPNGEADMRMVLDRFHAEGFKVGFHTLHPHIGLKSRYVTPVADSRLNKLRRFTLAAPIPQAGDVSEIAVFEPTADSPMFEPCRILQFGGELFSYERYSAEPPYKFTGVKRGAHNTLAAAHVRGEVGGILDVSEFGAPGSCYLDQNTDLQEEVGAKLARAYNCGFDYVYLDGSEGVNRPFSFHVANAQHRFWKLLKPEPLFGEAAAKTHFGWHMLAGANAFDTFPPEVFKENLRRYPFAQAPITAQDMTRVDFGWWSFKAPHPTGHGETLGTQADLWEYAVSVATAWDCAASIMMQLKELDSHPRTDDILEVMRLWADVRRRGLFREEWREELKDTAQEHHLLALSDGTYDLVKCDELLHGDMQQPIRAFFFARGGENWVTYWNCTGEGKFFLPVDSGKVALFDKYAGAPVPVESVEGGIVVPAGSRLYLKTSLPCGEIEAAFRAGSMVGMSMCAMSVCADTVFVEAESFKDWGGWVNDTQFMDQMGSPYLLAHGMGKPVADAKTTFFAKGGRYNVWVRTKNWTSWWHPDIGAGTFNLVVNGENLPNLLGCQGNGEWLWVKADDVTLKTGENTLALHDRDGFDGRVDAVVFTTEADSSTIRNGPRHPSVVIKPLPPKGYDLVVVGGGIAGICTAVSAARLGLSVALVQDRPVLGGNNSSEVRVHLGAYQNIPPYPRLGDVLAEFGPKRGGNAESAANYEDDRKLAIIKAEKNIRLFLNEHVNGVKTNEMGRILSVRSINTKTGVATWFEAANFADCTGDGTVGFLAGADFRMGREAKSDANEPDAPEKADMITMGASVQWYAGKADGDAAFPVRPWMLKAINEANCSPHLRGDWWWEAGFGRDQISEAEYIRDYGLLVAYSNWAFVKNGYSGKDAFADKELKWVAYNAGRRESRRLLGDFILDQNHLRNRDFQPDGTCVTTWTIDLHLPKTAQESKFVGEPYQSNSFNEKIWPYPVPYRCLYSRNVPNLFMAGRDISVTHIALGTTRLMRTHGMMGEVVGMAASVCKKHGCRPRDVYTTHLDELKELMTKGVGDGKKHPRQDYNVQQSLDPDIKVKYAEWNLHTR